MGDMLKNYQHISNLFIYRNKEDSLDEDRYKIKNGDNGNINKCRYNNNKYCFELDVNKQ